MRRKYWLTLLGIAFAGLALGQIKKQFTVEDAQSFENIRLSVKASSGDCYVKPSQNPEVLNVFSNQTESAYSHNFRKEIKGKTCDILLNLEENYTHGFGKTISTRFFGSSDKPVGDKLWKMYLTTAKPYSLDLNYGVGKANVDLSGLSIKNLKINTGSADIVVGYSSSLENQIDMDTFYIKTDLGSVNVRDMNFFRTRHVVADVGFGNMTLDFSSRPLVSNLIRGSVGAGNLVIILPRDETPVLIKIHDSWLCSVKIPKSLKEISDNTFVSSSYKKDAPTTLIFNLDVSMGNIIFKEASEN